MKENIPIWLLRITLSRDKITTLSSLKTSKQQFIKWLNFLNLHPYNDLSYFETKWLKNNNTPTHQWPPAGPLHRTFTVFSDQTSHYCFRARRDVHFSRSVSSGGRYWNPCQELLLKNTCLLSASCLRAFVNTVWVHKKK